MNVIANIFLLVKKVENRLNMHFTIKLFESFGENVLFSPNNSYFDYKNISVGNDVFIGPRAYLSTSLSKIILKNKIMLGPDVTMIEVIITLQLLISICTMLKKNYLKMIYQS